MPSFTFEDKDLLKAIANHSGYSFDKVVKKYIDQDGNVVVVVRLDRASK